MPLRRPDAAMARRSAMALLCAMPPLCNDRLAEKPLCTGPTQCPQQCHRSVDPRLTLQCRRAVEPRLTLQCPAPTDHATQFNGPLQRRRLAQVPQRPVGLRLRLRLRRARRSASSAAAEALAAASRSTSREWAVVALTLRTSIQL